MRYRITRWYWSLGRAIAVLLCAGMVALCLPLSPEDEPDTYDAMFLLLFGWLGLYLLPKTLWRRVVLRVGADGVHLGACGWLPGRDQPKRFPVWWIRWSEVVAVEMFESDGTRYVGVDRRVDTPPPPGWLEIGQEHIDLVSAPHVAPDVLRTAVPIRQPVDADRLAAVIASARPDVPLINRRIVESIVLPARGRPRRPTRVVAAVVVVAAVGGLVVGIDALAGRSPTSVPLRGVSAHPKPVGAAVSVPKEPRDIAVSPDGRRAYLTHRSSRIVSVLDTATGALTGTVALGSLPGRVVLSPDGRRAYTTGAGTVSVIDTATNTMIAEVVVGSDPEGLAVHPSGEYVYVTTGGLDTGLGREFSVINTATNSVIASARLTSRPSELAVSPDGRRAYISSCTAGTVSVLEPANGFVTATVSLGGCPIDLAVSPDGRRVYVAEYGTDAAPGSTVAVIDTATDTRVAAVPVGVAPMGLAFTPDGRYAYVANQGTTAARGNSVTVIDTATATPSDTVVVANGPVDVAFAPDGRRGYVASYSAAAVSTIDPGVR